MTLDRWIAAASLAIGIFSIAIAVYFYRRTDKKRTPTFMVNPARKSLVMPELAKIGEFSLLYKGVEIGKNGITSTQIYFWNSGSLAIQSSEVLKPYSISVSGASILSWSIIKTNRDIIRPHIFKADETFDTLQLSFSVLEPGDGAVLEIIYEGPANAKIEIDGICIGSHRPMILPSDPVYFSTRSKQLFNVNRPLILSLLIAPPMTGMIFGVIWLLIKLFGEKTGGVIFFMIGSCFIAFLIVVFIAFNYSAATNKYIPHDIKPD
jgi:hypothetical protein